MRYRRLWLIPPLLVFALTGCSVEPTCKLEGTYEVERLACTGHPDARAGTVKATYTFEGKRGRTKWTLPGCTVEAEFEITTHRNQVHLRETKHTCTPNDPAPGQTKIPCCESGSVDLALNYSCQRSPEGLEWMATLQREGDTGPWAGRGPWRGCPPGSLGMMQLKPTSSPGSK